MTWYQLGVTSAIRGVLFLAGVATVLAILAAAALTIRAAAIPAARKTIAIRARRRAWRTHHTSGRT